MVCGAPNARAGITAALAKVGARLAAGAHGQGTGKLENAVPLQAAVIRGVASEGMLCSEMELGLSGDHQGILELPPDAPVGHDLASYLLMADTVLDIAIRRIAATAFRYSVSRAKSPRSSARACSHRDFDESRRRR